MAQTISEIGTESVRTQWSNFPRGHWPAVEAQGQVASLMFTQPSLGVDGIKELFHQRMDPFKFRALHQGWNSWSRCVV